jgi:hypothetical protein
MGEWEWKKVLKPNKQTQEGPDLTTPQGWVK